MTTIYLPHTAGTGEPYVKTYDDAVIAADGTAQYGPVGLYHSAPGQYFLTEAEAQQALAGMRPPQPLYAIPKLPKDEPTPRNSRAATAYDRKRFVHALTIDDKPTAANIAAGTCRLICRPMAEFPKKRGYFTGLGGARVGDLIWVREPFRIYTGRRKHESFIATAADEAAVAATMTSTAASWESFSWNRDYHEATRQASALPRHASRMTLVVTKVLSGKYAPLLPFVTQEQACAAGFDGDGALDRFIASLRAQFPAEQYGQCPPMLIVEFAAYRAQVDAMLKWLDPMTTRPEWTTWGPTPPAQIRRVPPHECAKWSQPQGAQP